MLKITDDIYQINVEIPKSPLANINCYLIRGTDGWTMIDAGFFIEPSFASLNEGLDELGIKYTDIANIIITHIHSDHFGLAGRIKKLSPNTRIMMHRWEAELIETRYTNFFAFQKKTGDMLEQHGVPPYDETMFTSASMPTLEEVEVVYPDRSLYGGETLSTGLYELEVIWTPGHSVGHICLYEPTNRILFSGDHVLPFITPNVGYRLESGDDPLGDYLKALRKVRSLKVSRVLPGHQNVFEDLQTRIDAIFIHHEERKQEILVLLEAGPRHAYEISAHLSWNIGKSGWERLPTLQKRSAAMETLAHLERLRWEGEITRDNKAGVMTYSLATSRSIIH